MEKFDDISFYGHENEELQKEWERTFDNMKQYSVWMEGYVSTGMYAPASFVGSIEANSFREACQKIFKDDCSYNPERNTYWGCNLYDNESDARKSFG